MAKRIIVIGGGFGGVKCARTLRQKLHASDFQVVVFNHENHMVFHPLLAEVVGASVQPKDVGAPLRQLLTGVQCRTEDVTNIDLDRNVIFYESDDGLIKEMNYDFLVLTCGNSVNLSLVPGMDEHAFPLKTIGDALTLQAHVMQQMEKAEVCENQERRRWYLTFVIVGGGFSGVEVAGEINDLVRSSRKFFSNISEQDIRVVIVHSRTELLPEVSEGLRQFTRKKMEQAGVTVMLESKAAMATPEGLRLGDGSFLHAATVVCTIGTTTHVLINRLNAEKKAGRLATDLDMRLVGRENVFAIGDCAAVVNNLDGKLSPPVAQFAERQGFQVANNIVACVKGQPTKPFKHQMQGQLCAIGGRSAVAEVFNMRISGMFAWFLWRGIYLMKLPSFDQRLKVGIEWACDLIFPRTLAHLRADRTKRVGRSYYAAGDYVFRRGESATEFYIIEKGEVEILRHKDDQTTDCVAVLGSGDFFGESSLLDSTDRNHSVKARTELVCTVLGRNVFTQISSALLPVKEAIAKAAQRRVSMWQNIPDVRKIVDTVDIQSVMEALPMEPVRIDSSVENVISKMQATGADVCCVVDSDDMLVGVITVSDLVRGLANAALADPEVDLPVTEIMISDPIAITVGEPLAVAVSLMHDHSLKQIPVLEGSKRRIPIGLVRIKTIIGLVMAEALEQRKQSASV